LSDEKKYREACLVVLAGLIAKQPGAVQPGDYARIAKMACEMATEFERAYAAYSRMHFEEG